MTQETVAPEDLLETLRATRQALRSAKRAHAESESRFRMMADHAPVLLWMAGTDALCNFFNESWLRFSGRPMERELGNGWAEGIHFEDFQHCMSVYMTAFAARESFSMEYRLRRADGQYRWIFDQGVPRFGPDGTFVGYIGSCVDFTERREAQAALAKLNDELEERVRELSVAVSNRDILLREVHHRVKNNLQLVSSLLSIQAHQLEDESRAAINDCKSRVQTIALIHGGIYESPDLAHVPFSGYVRRIATKVLQGTAGLGALISLDVSVDDVAVHIDKAIPCGLLVNELMTNAVKHAFPPGRGGTIRVELRQLGRRVVLSVGDDGVGLPAEVDYRNTQSIGMRLLAMLGDQLQATIEIERNAGTMIRLTFDGGVEAAPLPQEVSPTTSG